MKLCSQPGCKRKHVAQGYCKSHYNEVCAKKCCIEDCERKSEKDLLCKYHRRRKERGLALNEPFGLGFYDLKFCSQAGCPNPHEALGLCGFHYRRLKRGIPFDQYRKQRYGQDAVCLANFCEEKPHSHGHCKFHAQRVRQGIDVNKPKRKAKHISEIPLLTEIKSFNWSKNSSGYLSTHIGKKEFLQHRVIWEAYNKRKLRRFENIHHKNGIRHDNRIENLELWTKPQPIGQRPEDLVDWVLEHYRELVEARLALL